MVSTRTMHGDSMLLRQPLSSRPSVASSHPSSWQGITASSSSPPGPPPSPAGRHMYPSGGASYRTTLDVIPGNNWPSLPTSYNTDFVFPDYRMAEMQDRYMWGDNMEGASTTGAASAAEGPHGHMDASSGELSLGYTSPEVDPLNRPMSVPAPNGQMYSPQVSTAARSRILDNPLPAHGGVSMPNSALNRPMSVPPPSAHMFNPPQMPATGSRTPLENTIPAHGGIGIGTTGGGGGGASSSVGSGGSPLVVPQPVKMTRPNKTYHCRMCDQIFESKSELLMHSQQIHKQDPKPYKCPTCGKCFANSSYLSQHNRIHSGVKPYKCQVCERKFTQLCHLQQHMRTHTGEKPYKCNHPGCGKAFTQLSNLQSHSRSHMTDKPYRCNSCYKCYADEQGLREHIPKHSETKHLKTQICRICGKSYTQETYLARHMQKHNFDQTGRSNVGLLNPSLIHQVAHSEAPHDIAKSTSAVSANMDGINTTSASSAGDMSPMSPKPPSASAFMPLGHPYGSPSNMMNTSMGAGFAFPPPRIPSTLNSPLPHISSVSPSHYSFFDRPTFPKREPLSSRQGVIPHSLLSLEQIKNFSAQHGSSVLPKSEPSSPVQKDFS